MVLFLHPPQTGPAQVRPPAEPVAGRALDHAVTPVPTENSVRPMLQALAPLAWPQPRRRPAARQVGRSPASHNGEPVPRFPRFVLTCN